MRLSDYVVQLLEHAGIGHIFTVCGGGSIFLCDALAKAPTVRYVACHHEQAAAMAAEAYARVRTGLGCAFVTSGPGGTNAITGVAGAWLDHVPVVVISGQTFLKQTIVGHPGLRTLGVQEINIVDLVRPITKYAAMVTDPKLIRFHVERALFMARDGRPGPVWLDIPADIQNAQIDPENLPGCGGSDYREADLGILGAFDPDQEARFAIARADLQIKKLIDLLRGSNRPVLHIGQGIRLAGAEFELAQFIQRSGIPVMTARNGNDLIDSGHPCYIGRPGTFAQRGANFAVQTCDAYLAVGTRLSLAQTGYNAGDYARNAKVVMVDIDEAELAKATVPLHMRILSDAKRFLLSLNEQSAGENWPDWSPWMRRCKEWQRRYPVVLPECRARSKYVNSYHLIEVLSQEATQDDVIVTDMGFAFQNTHQAWEVKLGQRLMTNCGLAPMGWGLPAAIGASFGSGRRVICIVGDGGIMMNVQELATIAHHRLNVKIFLLNNAGYLTMRQSQANAFDGYMGSDEDSGLSFPNFESLVESFGIESMRMHRHADVSEWVRRALARPGPVLCEVMMDPDQAQAPKSVNRREPDGTIKQTAIEDAWPYLPAEEIAENLQCENSRP